MQLRNKKGQFIKGSNPPKTAFKIGNKPWNLGMKGFRSGIKRWEVPSGEDSFLWKGDNVGYRGIHYWVEKHLGKPTKCEHCLKEGLFGKKIHWANISRKYKRDLTDWIRLCVKCHKIFDKND